MTDTDPSTDHGQLPDWRRADLPEPLPFSVRNTLRTIGPGAILLAAAIGGGEWIVGPLMTVKHGPGILWIVTVAVVLQSLFNLEAVRYTLYTGEPILTGVMRLNPGPWVWAPFYILIGTAQLATPAIAAGCATVLFAAFVGRMPMDTDQSALGWIGTGVILLCTALLLSGKSIERLLEKLSWAMIAFIFVFMIGVNVWCVPASVWAKVSMGFIVFQPLPEDINLVMLGLFAATAGSGGLGNIAISNWFRDKGFGMGAHVGSIGGALASGHGELQPVGAVFPMTADNRRRWRTWWMYACIDQQMLWGVGCVLGMFLNVNLAYAIVPPDAEVAGYAAGAFQAHYLAQQFWPGLWLLTLLNGFWILFSTHLGNTDCLVRTTSD
ncbi:MAG: Nramp family divalent metal transporter, partial [Planctomycetaceae bacterium]|nr:Nramp family divalent metal transporter [Planctomycetaceae bacterium]